MASFAFLFLCATLADAGLRRRDLAVERIGLSELRTGGIADAVQDMVEDGGHAELGLPDVMATEAAEEPGLAIGVDAPGIGGLTPREDRAPLKAAIREKFNGRLPSLEEAQRWQVALAWDLGDGVVSDAARWLGMPENTVAGLKPFQPGPKLPAGTALYPWRFTERALLELHLEAGGSDMEKVVAGLKITRKRGTHMLNRQRALDSKLESIAPVRTAGVEEPARKEGLDQWIVFYGDAFGGRFPTYPEVLAREIRLAERLSGSEGAAARSLRIDLQTFRKYSAETDELEETADSRAAVRPLRDTLRSLVGGAIRDYGARAAERLKISNHRFTLLRASF